MGSKIKPVYRDEILPWWDSNTLCAVFIFFMTALFLFSITGIAAALENEAYKSHVWIPILIAFLSGFVSISMAVRLITRYIRQRTRRK